MSCVTMILEQGKQSTLDRAQTESRRGILQELKRLGFECAMVSGATPGYVSVVIYPDHAAVRRFLSMFSRHGLEYKTYPNDRGRMLDVGFPADVLPLVHKVLMNTAAD